MRHSCRHHDCGDCWPALDVKNSSGDLPLHIAARHFALAPAADSLLARVCPSAHLLNSCDSRGAPALCYVAAAGNAKACDALLARGADASARDADDATAMHWLAAASITQLAAVRAIKAGEDPGAAAKRESVSAKARGLQPQAALAMAGDGTSMFQALQALRKAYCSIIDKLAVRASHAIDRVLVLQVTVWLTHLPMTEPYAALSHGRFPQHGCCMTLADSAACLRILCCALRDIDLHHICMAFICDSHRCSQLPDP